MTSNGRWNVALKDIWSSKCVKDVIPHNNGRSTSICDKRGRKCLQIFKGKPGELYVFEFDGCILRDKNVRKCDYVAEFFHNNRWMTSYLIELKGNKIKEAIEQIESSYRILKKNYNLNDKNTKIICIIIFSGRQSIPRRHASQREFLDTEIRRRGLNVERCFIKRNKQVIRIDVDNDRYW